MARQPKLTVVADDGAPPGVEIRGPARPGQDEILTPEALEFIAMLERKFGSERRALLDRRADVQARLDHGAKPDFLAGTADIRNGDWTVGPVPDDLQDRRVEITGPVERKMIINALNCGASAFMADFEDSLTPTWANLIDGQINLRDAAKLDITFDDPKSGKHYELGESPAVLIVRPRGWHLEEANIHIDGRAMSASLFDFGLYFFHNAKTLGERGSGPYFYIPKIENHLEARLWNDVFVAAQEALGIANGTIKVTVLIETILAAFEMDEILYELRDHIAGLNCGRWDYIFSFIKKFRNDAACILPDRGDVTMTRHFLHSYSLLLIKTCHRRGAHAIGGMAAQIPIKGDAEANDQALAKVRADKEREAGDGHDGTWVAHPGLVKIAKDIFDEAMPQANQVGRMLGNVTITAADLLAVPEGDITESGVRANLSIGIQYTAAWLSGLGCVPLNNLMEDAATAEISRSQLWQWRRHGAKLDDGRTIDDALIRTLMYEELSKITAAEQAMFGEDELKAARDLFEKLIFEDDFTEFLTLPAYEHLVPPGAP
jgi:malate synthase